MIEVTDAFKRAWLNGNQKYILLSFSDGSTLDDEGIVSESFSLEQSLCTESQFCFGLTSSACCKVQIFNTGKQYKGLSMTVTMSAVDENDQYYLMEMGTYTIESDVRSDDRSYRTLTAYDSLYDVLNTNYADFYNDFFAGRSNPTLLQFRNAFFAYIGIEQELASLLNDNVVLVKKPNVTSISGSDIIKGICETSAAFGFLNYDGNFQYVMPTERSRAFPADDLYPANDLYPSDGADVVLDGSDVESAPILGGMVYSDYYTHKITQAKFAYTENTSEAVYGTTGNTYQFQDSVLMYGQSASSLQGICSRFLGSTSEFFYTPSKITARARIWAQPGDILRATSETDSVIMIILKRSMSGVTALYDTYEAQGAEYYIYSVNSYEAQQTENEVKTSEVTEYIEEVAETVEELDQSWRNSVSASLDVWDDSNEEIDEYGFGEPTVDETDVEWNGSYDLVGNGEPPATYQYSEDDLGLTYLNESTGQYFELQRIWKIPNVEYKIVWQPQGYASGSTGGYTPEDVGIKYLDEETGKVYVLESYTDGSLTKYRWVYNKQLIKTKAQLSTRIEQTAEAITLEATRAISAENTLSASIEVNANAITQRVVKGDVVSEINQSSDTISLTAGRLLITTGNFTLDVSGNATATNFTADSSFKLKNGNDEVTISTLRFSNVVTFYVQAAMRISSNLTVIGECGVSSLFSSGNADIRGNLSVSGSISAGGSTLATQSWVNNKGYLTSSSLSGYFNSISNGSSEGTWSEGTTHVVVNQLSRSGSTITTVRYTGYVSDKRLKEKISDIPDYTAVYMRLEPKEYNYHSDLNCLDGLRHYGVMAQDFHDICVEEGIDISHHAIWHERKTIEEANEEKYVGECGMVQMFEKDELHALHIQMIQKQQRQIEAQQQEIDELRATVNELKNIVNELRR